MKLSEYSFLCSLAKPLRFEKPLGERAQAPEMPLQVQIIALRSTPRWETETDFRRNRNLYHSNLDLFSRKATTVWV